MCKVFQCHKSHSRHYCSVCQDRDSSHFSRECPNSITVYYGAVMKWAKEIEKIGFKSGKYGSIGPGVYFTDSFRMAIRMSESKCKNAQLLEKQNRQSRQDIKWAVLECKIPKFTQQQRKSCDLQIASSVPCGGLLALGRANISNFIRWLSLVTGFIGDLISIDSASDVDVDKHPSRVEEQKKNKYMEDINLNSTGVSDSSFKEIYVREGKMHNIKIVKLWPL